MSAAVSRFEVAKEIRALLPIWVACLAALGGAYLQQADLLMLFGIGAFVAGPSMLGAHAIGYEYGYRTLPMLLVQPIDRRRILLVKLSVVAVMTLIIAAVASIVLAAPTEGMWRHWYVRSLPIVASLSIAPWMAMVCRSSLAATAVTGTMFSSGLIAATVITSLTMSISMDAAQQRVVQPWAMTMIAICVVFAVLSVLRFSRLEAGDGAPLSFTLPRLGGQRVRRYQPIAALIGKELQLQQLTFAIALLFVVTSLALVVMQRVVSSWTNAPVAAIMLLYCLSLALLIGAIASAEERQLGVFEWQLVTPASAIRQWMVKVVVVMLLAIAFAAMLPALLIQLTPLASITAQNLVLPVMLLAAAGLYLSSLANSSAWAMVLSLPAGVATALFFRALDRVLVSQGGFTAATLREALPIESMALVITPLLLWLAFVNHRSIERQRASLVWQVAVLALAVAVTRVASLNL